MINKEAINALSRAEGLKPHQEEKKYIQMLILRALSTDYVSSLIFKGGTALFLLYGLSRFSEDLDFTTGKDLDFTTLLRRVSKTLELTGVKNSTTISDNTSNFSGRIKAYGPLYTKEINACFVKIDISQREKVELKPNFTEINGNFPDILPFSILNMNETEILAEKIRAIMTRDQARDIYDLYFLLNKNIKIDLRLVDKKLLYYKIKFTKDTFIKSLTKKEGIWKQELNPFIIGNIPELNDVIKKIIGSL